VGAERRDPEEAGPVEACTSDCVTTVGIVIIPKFAYMLQGEEDGIDPVPAALCSMKQPGEVSADRREFASR
jgi:hypothetical protein